MTSTIGFHHSPSAGFDEPFEMLAACHERVERMLALLERLAAHVQQQGNDASARQAARDVMRYFDQAGPAHHEDEERHIFPPLLQDAELGGAVRQLQADHVEMAVQWAGVRADLAAVEQGGGLPEGAPARLGAFAALYRRHIVAEDHTVYPAARTRLDSAAQRAMGQEMARRRGVR